MSARIRTLVIVTFAAVAVVGTAPALAQTTWYVDDDAPLGGNGLTWQTALRFLQDALEVAASDDEIRVAGGSYAPDQDEDDPNSVTPGDREASFELITGVGLYGGYAGLADPNDPNRRDPNAFVSILSGDLAANDDPNAPPDPSDPVRSENSYHVVTGSATDETAVLDGFTVTAGNASDPSWPNSHGGGMFNNGGSPTLANCVFTANTALYSGGALINHNESSPTVTHCTFGRNAAPNEGGMQNWNNSSPLLSNCTFVGNTATERGGGGMGNGENSNPTLLNCTFTNNSATWGGGMNNETSNPTLTNCTFSGNSAADNGGGMHNYQSSPALIDCVFSGNTASSSGGAIDTSDSTLLVVKCVFRENGAGQWGGAVCNGGTYNPGITLVACSFISNYAEYGGGLLDWNTDPLTVVGCEFLGNTSGDHGGAVLTGGSYTSFMNCVFSGNFAPGGGGAMHNYLSSDVTLTNCTVSHNSAYAEAGGLVNRPGCQGAVRNCVLWGNSSGAGSLESWQIYGDWTDVGHSCIQGLDAYAGAGNIDGDPLFFDPSGPDGIPGTADDDLRLSLGSPCTDAGDNTAVPADTWDLDDNGDTSERIPFDLGGQDRFADDCSAADTGMVDPNDPNLAIVDMGAYEYYCPGDANGDRYIDIADLAALLSAYFSCRGDPEYIPASDLDCDGCVDLADLAALLAAYRTTCP